MRNSQHTIDMPEASEDTTRIFRTRAINRIKIVTQDAGEALVLPSQDQAGILHQLLDYRLQDYLELVAMAL